MQIQTSVGRRELIQDTRRELAQVQQLCSMPSGKLRPFEKPAMDPGFSGAQQDPFGLGPEWTKGSDPGPKWFGGKG